MTTEELRSTLLDRIEELGVSISHAAQLATHSPASLIDWLKGKSAGVNYASAARLAEVLGLEIKLKPIKGYVKPEPRKMGPQKKKGE
jgi:membrane-bound lytic murein transglycosylase MltF